MSTLTGPSLPPADGGPARQLVVLLHGVGADGNDLIGLAPMLQPQLPGARFVAPNGPQACDMAPFGYQWFSLQDRGADAMLEGIKATAPVLDAFIDAELETHGLGAGNLALLGFSQGTMLALYVAPRRPEAIAALVGFSGALLDPADLAAETRSHPRTLLVHGEADEVVPFQALAAARDGLAHAGLPVETMSRPGLGHGIDQEGIERATTFLKTAFAEPPAG